VAKTHFQTFIDAYSAINERERELGGDYVLCPPEDDFGYSSTPKNALTFARMGVDGVHWAILKIDGEVKDDSPIVYVSPMDSHDVTIMAESLLDFLAFGCRVSPSKMEAVFDAERSGSHRLFSFLTKHFQRDGLLADDRIAPLMDRLGHLIECRDGYD
jgi:hypothetical protein